MFLKGIKRKLAQKYINKHCVANREIDQQKIKTLGVLIDARVFKEFPFTNELATLFDVPKSAITLLYYQPNKQLAKEVEESVFTDNALAFNGQVKGDAVLSFINKEFDALLNFHDENQLLLNLVSVHSKAKFKIGFSVNNAVLNDFTVAAKLTDIEIVIIELKKYLSILNKI